MGNVILTAEVVRRIKGKLCGDEREIRHFDLNRSPWYVNRYVSVACANKRVPIGDLRFHYQLSWNNSLSQYENCNVFLEASENSYRIRALLRYLREKTASREDVRWETLQRCRLLKPIEVNDDLPIRFQEMADIFDPLVDSYYEEQAELERALAFGDGIPFSEIRVPSLTTDIVKVKDLPFSSFRIPSYQRTYRWKGANVSQLINDIREYAKDSPYRLGSLVLHNGDIVDGQQRIVTLSLLLHRMMRNPEIRSHGEYQGLFDQVTGFWGRTEYKSAEAIENIVANAALIRTRQDDLDYAFFETLAERCEFVVIRLPELHEAFQFFDSQNARGKDLEPHDLLKAYHLREIDRLDDADREAIRIWQKIPTPRLVSLFLCLYRIRKWSKGESARFFTKSDVGEFKGLSIGKDTSPLPLYRQALLLNRLFTEFSQWDGGGLLRRGYPFQLSGLIVNGSRFFDMVLHYDELYSHVKDPSWEEYDPDAKDILTLLGDYDGMYRTGDEYIRNVFDALLLFYVDKFGTRWVGKAARLFFLYAYSIRIKQVSVSLASVDKAVTEGTLFKTIRDATDPYDVLNCQVPAVKFSDLAKNRSEDLYNRFEDMNMVSHGS